MHIITTTEELQSVCDRFASDTFVTVDTEFMRETTYWPLLCLIQMAGESDEVIIDPLSEELSLDPFFELMTNTSVIKVFHAARQDLEIFYTLMNEVPQPLFDTQVAALAAPLSEGPQCASSQYPHRSLVGYVDASCRAAHLYFFGARAFCHPVPSGHIPGAYLWQVFGTFILSLRVREVTSEG